MANDSLTAKLFPNNEIINLAKLLEIPLLYYRENNSPIEKDHIKELRTIIGLGFTAILVDGAWTSIYERYLRAFLVCDQLTRTEDMISQLALATAEIAGGASYIFRILNHPEYYKDFEVALKKVVNHLSIRLYGKSEEAERLLKILLNNRSQYL
jgi:hypothetical protein